MKHHVVAHIDAHMGRAGSVIGALEEHQIAGLQLGDRVYPGAQATLPVGLGANLVLIFVISFLLVLLFLIIGDIIYLKPSKCP